MTYQNYPQQYAGLELLETPVMIVERNGRRVSGRGGRG